MSNSALVRVPPLIIWCSSLESDEDVKKAIVSDVEITHPNKTVQDIVFVYAMTLRFLLNNYELKDRAWKAFQLAMDLAKSDLGNSVSYQKVSCLKLL